jgi:hypothetical protein
MCDCIACMQAAISYAVFDQNRAQSNQCPSKNSSQPEIGSWMAIMALLHACERLPQDVRISASRKPKHAPSPGFQNPDHERHRFWMSVCHKIRARCTMHEIQNSQAIQPHGKPKAMTHASANCCALVAPTVKASQVSHDSCQHNHSGHALKSVASNT